MASLAIGLVLVRHALAVEPTEGLTWARVRHSGGPLLAVGVIPSAVTFVISFIVTRLVGAATLGYVEAARVLTQPVTVVGVGLAAVLGPRITQAAAARDRVEAGRLLRRSYGLLLAVGAAYLAGGGVPLPFNPLVALVPTAYVVPGLLAVSIVAYSISNLTQPARAEQLGAHRERFAARVEVEGNAGAGGGRLDHAVAGAFAVPLGQAALAVVRQTRYRAGLAAWYGTPDGHARPAEGPPPG